MSMVRSTLCVDGSICNKESLFPDRMLSFNHLTILGSRTSNFELYAFAQASRADWSVYS